MNVKNFLLKIWPTIYRFINTFLYFIFSLFKTAVALALKQIKE